MTLKENYTGAANGEISLFRIKLISNFKQYRRK